MGVRNSTVPETQWGPPNAKPGFTAPCYVFGVLVDTLDVPKSLSAFNKQPCTKCSDIRVTVKIRSTHSKHANVVVALDAKDQASRNTLHQDLLHVAAKPDSEMCCRGRAGSCAEPPHAWSLHFMVCQMT